MKKGFSLIEIMVVVVVMGILAAVGVPKIFGQIENAKIAVDIQSLSAVNTAVVHATLDESFQQAFDKTISNDERVMRMRISWAIANQNSDKAQLHKLVIEAIKANAGSNYIELGSKTSYSDGNVAAVYQSNSLRKKQLDMMVLIVENSGHFNIVTFPTTSAGKDPIVYMYTYRGRPVAAGDVPKDGEAWGNQKKKVTFKYIPLED